MKTKASKKFTAIAFGFTLLSSLFTMTSCEDMLTVDNDDKIYVNANDTVYSYFGILKAVQDIAERQIILGELRGDLVSTTQYVTDTLHAIANFDDPQDGSCSMLNLRDYYNVINNCNLYIYNADTSVVKSNVKYMLPEYAQVCAIRAWTYLMLVQNYGSVPFITAPVTSLDVIDNFDYSNNLVNKDNLIDKILGTGIDQFLDTYYPSYGSWDNGAVSIAARKAIFPIRLILGDMYLLRGGSNNDYRKAAQYYYEYLNKTAGITTSEYCIATKNKGRNATEEFKFTSSKWGDWASQYTASDIADGITAIPSSANRQFGTMLTRVADIYGYTPTSSQSSNTVESSDGSQETSSSGAITVSPNYKSQTQPSGAYVTVNKNQSYIYYDNSIAVPVRLEYESGDARYGVSREEHQYDGEPYELCCKAAHGATFYYTIPVYRRSLVWLRLAEAINRSGFPQMAFAILKDGLCENNLPKHAIEYNTHLLINEQGDTVRNESGEYIVVTDTIPYLKLNNFGAMYYVDSLELDNFYLDFSDDTWNGNFGVHARGCGYGSWPAQASNNIRTNIGGYGDSITYDYSKLIIKQGYDPAVKDDAIEAVENLIVDELALELAFEGYRFTDLVRIANHKNLAGKNGTEWLAAKIADRDIRTNRFKGTSSGERNQEIYGKLKDENNWYFSVPKWGK